MQFSIGDMVELNEPLSSSFREHVRGPCEVIRVIHSYGDNLYVVEARDGIEWTFRDDHLNLVGSTTEERNELREARQEIEQVRSLLLISNKEKIGLLLDIDRLKTESALRPDTSELSKQLAEARDEIETLKKASVSVRNLVFDAEELIYQARNKLDDIKN